jgi:hypothetical protein
MARRTPRTAIDSNLVRRLQLAVAGDAGSDSRGSSEFRQEHGDGEQAHSAEALEGRGDLGLDRERFTQGKPGPWKPVARRTTLSVPPPVAEKARQLTMAIMVAERRDSSLGRTLSWALELLEAELRQREVPIGDRPAQLRSGPRGG